MFSEESLLLIKPVSSMCIDDEIINSSLTDQALLIIFVSVLISDMGNN